MGRLTGTDGEYFTQELATFVEEQGGRHLDLNLREVKFMSDEAIEALKRRQVAVRVIGCNGLLQKLLEAGGVGLLLPDKKEEAQE